MYEVYTHCREKSTPKMEGTKRVVPACRGLRAAHHVDVVNVRKLIQRLNIIWLVSELVQLVNISAYMSLVCSTKA